MPTTDTKLAFPRPSACLLRPCHQTILWSKNGIICYALHAETGPNLNITFLENTDGKNWQLAPSQGLTIRPLDARTAQKLVLVQWSNISTDLAVFDELGNFYILLAGVGLLKNKRLLKSGTPGTQSTSSAGNVATASKWTVNGPNLGAPTGGNSSTSLAGKETNGTSKASTPLKGSNNSAQSGTGSGSADKDNGVLNNKTEEQEAPSYELTSYNHTEMIYRDIQSGASGQPLQGQCVAFKWLMVDKPQIVNKPAKWSAESNSYVYSIQQYKLQLLVHPIPTKQACLAVRQSGIVDLYYQGEHKVEYHKLSVDLGAGRTASRLNLTHASIGFSADKKIIITALDVALNLILTFSLALDWGFLVASALRQSKDPHYHTPKEEQTPPSLVSTLVHQMKPSASMCVGVSASAESDSRDDAMDLDIFPNAANERDRSAFIEANRLVLIDTLSPYHAQTATLDVLITYEHISLDPKQSVSFKTQRFQYMDVSSTVPSCFSAVGGSGNAQTGQLYSLVLQDVLSIPGRFQSLSLALSESIILFALESGDFVPISRSTWKSLGNSTEVKKEEIQTPSTKTVDTLATLFDCGFCFPTLLCEDRHFAYAVSPNMTSVVYFQPSCRDSLSLAVLRKTSRIEEHQLASIGFAHTHAHACYSNACSDDLMVLIKTEYDKIQSKEQQHSFLEKLNTEAHCAINFHLSSFGKESVDKLLSNPPLQKLLSLQLALSDLADNKKTRDIAWVVLNLRFTSFGIMFTLSSIYRQMSKKKSVEDTLEDSIHRAECVYLLVGNVKWLIDFIVYLNQELAQLLLSKQDREHSLVTVENSIALPIILSKIPRLFLMYALSSIGKTHEILKKLHKDLSEHNKLFTPMKEALDRFLGACSSLPWKVSNFESFLRECEGHISKELAPKLADRALLLRMEQDLFCRGKIPAEYVMMANAVIERHGHSISRDTKLSELFFYDTSWIAVGAACYRNGNESENTPATNPAPNYPKGAIHEPMDVDDGSSRPRKIAKKMVGTLIRQPYSKHEAVDALRKIFISCSSPVFSGGPSQMGRGYISADKVRKCVRCRSVSLVADPLVFDTPHVIALWTMVFQRTCICGSAWVNCIYT